MRIPSPSYHFASYSEHPVYWDQCNICLVWEGKLLERSSCMRNFLDSSRNKPPYRIRISWYNLESSAIVIFRPWVITSFSVVFRIGSATAWAVTADICHLLSSFLSSSPSIMSTDDTCGSHDSSGKFFILKCTQFFISSPEEGPK